MHAKWRVARRLRRTMTDAERRLWQGLRGRQMHGHKFRRQYPLCGYVVDFVCLEASLVIEADGGQHAEQTAYDEERTRKLEQSGFRMMRFWNDEILRNTEIVLETIFLALDTTPPQPSPSRKGREKSKLQRAPSGKGRERKRRGWTA